MLTCRSACLVEEALLGQQHIGLFGMLALPYTTFAGCDLLKGPTQMHSSCAGTCLRLPGYRPIKGKIDLKYAGAIAVVFKLMLVALRQALSCDTQELAGGYV